MSNHAEAIDLPLKHVVAPLTGGLGNQLFQAVHAQVIFAENIAKGTLLFDKSWLEIHAKNAHERIHPQFGACLPAAVENKPAPRRSVLQKLRLCTGLQRKAIETRLPNGLRYKLKMSYKPREQTGWVNELFMDGDVILEPAAQAFLKKLKEQTVLKPAYAELQHRLRASGDFATLHVRRGDYLKAASFMPTMAYYQRALEMIERLSPGVDIWIHSDDIAWCKSQPLFQRKNCHFLDLGSEADALQEMLVLGEARYVIMANSTFSWWISAFARVCQPSYCQSFMPSRWFGVDTKGRTHDFHRSDIVALRAWD